MTKLNKQEQGRSIVEMLGVLAVVGVLSIGGIMGYNYATEKNKANDLLDGVSKSAMTLAQKTMMGALIEEKTLTGTDGLSFGGYTVKSLAQEDGQSYFEIQAIGIPEKICKLTLEKNVGLSNQTHLGAEVGEDNIVWKNGEVQSTAPSCADNDNNTITWLFDNNLDTTVEISLASAEEEEEEEEEEETCPSGASTENDESHQGGSFSWEGNTCYCQTDTTWDADAEECGDYSDTFVAGAGGILDDLIDTSKNPNHGCPDGYTWATVDQVEANLTAINNGTKCATCSGGKLLWTATLTDCLNSHIGSICAYCLSYTGDLTSQLFPNFYGYALCVKNGS